MKHFLISVYFEVTTLGSVPGVEAAKLSVQHFRVSTPEDVSLPDIEKALSEMVSRTAERRRTNSKDGSIVIESKELFYSESENAYGVEEE